jgi:hypothetical protein
MANNIDINYDDERFGQVESDKQQALTEVEETYGGMIGESDKYYQAQIDASKQWADKQQQLQQENTDFTIEQIEQQKQQAGKDYQKEQSGAYVDFQKESNKYGANAEQMAGSGLTNTGYSESAKVSMFNTYQNRVAVAREGYNQAILNYNNGIKEAQLQNNSALAEIHFQALQQQLELSLQGFQYKNQLVLEQANKKQEIDNTYYSRYQDVLNQMNHENAQAEQIRQYNESLKLQQQQLKEEIRQFEQSYALQEKQYEESIRQFDAEMERLKKKDAEEYKLEIQRLELQKQQVKQEQAQWEKEYQLKKEQLAQEESQFSRSLSASQKSGSTGGSGGIDDTYAVQTAYYQGDLNPDANKYGTFSNNYQPKGISGHGTLSKSKKNGKVEQITIQTQTLSGQKQTVVQNVWKAEDGTKWYWEGRQNKYIQIK